MDALGPRVLVERRLPQAGTGYTVHGAYNSAAGTMYQTVTIPSAHNAGHVFSLDVPSSETTTARVYDRLLVEVRSTAGALSGRSAT